MVHSLGDFGREKEEKCKGEKTVKCDPNVATGYDDETLYGMYRLASALYALDINRYMVQFDFCVRVFHSRRNPLILSLFYLHSLRGRFHFAAVSHLTVDPVLHDLTNLYSIMLHVRKNKACFFLSIWALKKIRCTIEKDEMSKSQR